jgi:hypothetical protein
LPNNKPQRTRTAEMSDDNTKGAAAVRGPLQREVNFQRRLRLLLNEGELGSFPSQIAVRWEGRRGSQGRRFPGA